MSWCWILFSGLLLSELDASPRGVVLEPLEFDITSEHQLLHHDGPTLVNPGNRWNEPEWSQGRPYVVPFSHDGGKDARLTGKLKLRVSGVAPGSEIRLRGLSHEPGFNVDGQLIVPADAPAGTNSDERIVEATMRAMAPVGSKVRKIRDSIVWFAEVRPIGNEEISKHDLGSTGPLVGYILRGKPKLADEARGTVTARRLDIAVERYTVAHDNAGDNPSSLAVVAELVGRIGKHYLPTRHYEAEGAWNVPETWTMSPPGASCFSIITYTINVLNMVGQEGEFELVTYTARQNAPEKAVIGSLGEPPVRQSTWNDTWQLFLADDRNTRLGQVGGLGGMNFYEAVLRYKHGGQTYFMPGGTSRVYTNPDDILRVFRTMVWAKYDNRKNEWKVMRVVHTYVQPGGGSPRGVDVSAVNAVTD
ncbi:MAG: hypothetical protein ACK5DV_12760 [Planctomycetota bacterium]|jgi:hypothetical protein